MTETSKLQFEKDTDGNFYHDLKLRILPLMSGIQRKATVLTWVKIILFPSAYLFVYILLMTHAEKLWHLYLGYAIFGMLMPLNVVNIVHDAIHGCLLKNKTGNFLARHVLDVLGGNSYVWQKRHVVFHHPTPNVIDWDIDIERRKLYTLSPADDHKQFHRYQHLYMPFVFPLFTLHWVLFRDFKDYFDPQSMFRRKVKVPKIEFIKLPFFKTIYLLHIIVMPIVLLDFPWYHIILAFIVLHVIAAIGALIILLPNHWDEDAEFHHPVGGRIEESWAVYQFRNTNDFAIENGVANFLMGGLNHHVAHHLFPGVNHNYLPGITKEVISIAREKGMHYKCFSLTQAIATHFRLLKKNGFKYNLLEEAFE